jgi:conjugal transfer pilus assembly protein TraI
LTSRRNPCSHGRHTNAVSSYPASDPGFAALSVDELLASEADLIARIKLCYGTDRTASSAMS